MSNYTLEPITEELNKFTVTIIADSNDADYITTINTYSKDVFEDHVANGLTELLQNYSDRHKLEEYEGDFDDIPYGEYGRCHTLESIDIKYVDENGLTFNVVLGDE